MLLISEWQIYPAHPAVLHLECSDPLTSIPWMTFGARDITLSEDINRDLITMCNGCYGTLNDVNTQLKEDPSKKAKVNEHLKKINKKYKGSQRVRHIVEIIYNNIGLENIKKRIIKPLGLNIAVHYGCHVLKPHDNKPWKTGCEDRCFSWMKWLKWQDANLSLTKIN